MSKTINTLRDRLLLRLLSQPTRDALFRTVLYDIEDEIAHCREVCEGDTRHVGYAKCHLADLIEEKPMWVAQLQEVG